MAYAWDGRAVRDLVGGIVGTERSESMEPTVAVPMLPSFRGLVFFFISVPINVGNMTWHYQKGFYLMILLSI